MKSVSDAQGELLPVATQARKRLASRTTSWPVFAETLRWQRCYRWPGCVPMGDETDICPHHGVELGSISRMCIHCHHAAWRWTAGKYEELHGRIRRDSA